MTTSPRTLILQKRLARWRERMAVAIKLGDDPAYVAICRAKIEELTDALGQDAEPGKRAG